MTDSSIPLLRRGQIVLVSFDPVIGSETSKTRPAVLVSNNAANAVAMRSPRATVTVVPVTFNTVRLWPFQVLLPAYATGLAQDSKAAKVGSDAQPRMRASISTHRNANSGA